jgi:hypothetical protein
MKKVIVFLSLLVVIFLLIYFLGPNLLSRLTKDLNPFPTKGDQVIVEIKGPDIPIPKDMKITNTSKIKVRVYAYNADDWVRLIARKEWVLNPDKSETYPLGNYWFKVVQPEAIRMAERKLAESQVFGSDLEITGDQKHIKILIKPKKLVTFTNKTNENLKICAFNPDDGVLIIPLTACWYIGPDRRTAWGEAPLMFTIRVYRPQFVDKILATEVGVQDQSDIVIRSRGIWDRIKDLFS